MIKLTISFEELLIGLFVGPVLLAAAYNIVVFTYRYSKLIHFKVTEMLSFKRKYKKLEEDKKAGFLHSWVTVKHPSVGNITVCKESGFCPTLYGFFDTEWIAKYLKSEKVADSAILERNKFFEDRLSEIKVKYSIADINSVADEILNINKQFTIKKLDELQKLLKEQV